MTNKGIIAAALILGASIIFAVWLPIHHQEVRRLDQERKAACEEERAGFQRCYSGPYATKETYVACSKDWQPVINELCYGKK